MYIQDFDSIDKDHNGGISYQELQFWIQEKAKTEGGSWNIVVSHPAILKIAHLQSSKVRKGLLVSQRIVSVLDFRQLLLHLFAISILWVHFKNADEWAESDDVGNFTLSLQEFTLAVKSFTASHSGEEVSESQIEQDFRLLDVNNSNSLGFFEVCDYCCKFINEALVEDERKATETNETEDKKVTETSKGTLTGTKGLEADLFSPSSSKENNRFNSVETRTSRAFEAIGEEIEKNQIIADFTEVKVSTENTIKDIFINMSQPSESDLFLQHSPRPPNKDLFHDEIGFSKKTNEQLNMIGMVSTKEPNLGPGIELEEEDAEEGGFLDLTPPQAL